MEEHKEKMVLSHDPVPGYRPVFYVAVAIGVLYLLLAFAGVV